MEHKDLRLTEALTEGRSFRHSVNKSLTEDSAPSTMRPARACGGGCACVGTCAAVLYR